MIIWLLSKLFNVQTLAKAIARKKSVVACHVTTEQDITNMAAMFEDMALNMTPYMKKEENVKFH